MKKSLLIAAMLAGATVFSGWAQDAESGQQTKKRDYKFEFVESSLNYRSVPIYRVLDHKDAYIVLYLKGHRDIGEVTIPKSWYSSDGKKAKKLQFRTVSEGILPCMTVFSRDGNFDHVLLTMPLSRRNTIWAVAETGRQVEGLDKENLDDFKF